MESLLLTNGACFQDGVLCSGVDEKVGQSYRVPAVGYEDIVICQKAMTEGRQPTVVLNTTSTAQLTPCVPPTYAVPDKTKKASEH